MVLFRSITPLLPAGADLTDALAFYTRHLGFTVEWQAQDLSWPIANVALQVQARLPRFGLVEVRARSNASSNASLHQGEEISVAPRTELPPVPEMRHRRPRNRQPNLTSALFSRGIEGFVERLQHDLMQSS